MKTKSPKKVVPKLATKPQLTLSLNFNAETKTAKGATFMEALNQIELPKIYKTMIKLDAEVGGRHFYRIFNIRRFKLCVGRPMVKQMLAHQVNTVLGLPNA